jgi:hypothetical protein
MTTQNIPFTPPKARDMNEEELRQHIDRMHQLIFQKFENHQAAFEVQTGQISTLQAQVKALQGK